MINSQFRGESSPNPSIVTKDTGGTNRSLRDCSDCLIADSGVGVTDFGIRVGTDNTAVDIENYQLGAAIAEGAGAGQLNHLATTCTYVGVVGNDCSFTVQRQVNNNSGGDITIQEIAIYNKYRMVGLTQIYIMSCRDLAVELVPNGGNITVTYTIKISL